MRTMNHDGRTPVGEAMIFIVDDEPFNRDIAGRFVKKMGYQAKEFGGGPEVLQALAQGLPDLLLLDIHMPGMNGLQVLARARELSTKSEFPILMVTADSNPDTVVEAFDLGANDYVTKPIDSKTLRARIETHIQLSLANRQSREFAEGAERIVADQAVILQKRNEDLVREVKLRMQVEEDLRAAKQRAEADNRAKSEFLAVMTHELITPLHVALGFSDLIAGDASESIGPAQQREYGGHIATSLRKLLVTVKDMLALARYDIGRLKPQDAEVGLRELLQDAIEGSHPNYREAGVAVDLECPQGLELLGDRVLLARAFACIVSNAVKFSHRGAACRVVCRLTDEGCVSVKVIDEGIGFDIANLSEIMKPFRQNSGGLDRTHEGLGIGLPLANTVLDMHGASMEITSRPGVGTSVEVGFPKSRTLTGAPARQQRASA
jgi:signal transduction histidine kinase